MGVPNLTALVVGTFLPISPILAVLLNNGSSLVAAANAMRVLGFRAKELPPANLETVAGPNNVSPTKESRRGEAVQTHASKGGATGSSVPTPEVVASVVSATDGIPDSSLEVSLAELSSRLSLKHQTITARRRRADFSSWVRSHDPEGHGWSYCSQTKMYRSVVA